MLTRRRRLLIVVLAVLGVVALASRAFLAKDAGETRYRTEPVSRGAITASVTATGTVNPLKTVQVGTYVSGPIQEIDADFNSQVRRGQRVAKIDPRPFQLRLRGAEAALANARARLTKARADLRYKATNLERNRRLRAEGIVAEDALDTAASSLDQARAEAAYQEAQVHQAESEVEEARVNLGYTDILSPVDGVVVSRNVDVGQTVAASFQTPTLFVIAEDLTKMQVNANVSEADIGTVREGQLSRFTVDAYPERVFEGRVEQVRNSPLNVQNVITYDVVIDAPNADLALRPGMTANVEIVTGQRTDVLRVPTAALRFRPPQDAKDGRDAAAASGAPPAAPAPLAAGARVWILAGGRPKPIAVESGLADDSYTEIRGEGIAEGDAVIVAVDRRASDDTATVARPPGFAVGPGGGRRR